MDPIASPRRPFFFDVTLRDGNQALRRPWNLTEKERIFRQLLTLGVQGIEVSFPAASRTDFEAARHLASLAPDDVVISGLARAVESDIRQVWEALKHAPHPRMHIVLATSPFAMEHVLRLSPGEVMKRATHAVGFARTLMGGRGSIQFSAEHFGDCTDNLDFVIEVFHAVVERGAHVVNLPNTVERYRPRLFVDMVERVVQALPPDVTVAVHAHNDLGMATATTVESYFAGATQLETALNGLGERAGNTNTYEVACALANCGEDVPLNMAAIYDTAQVVAEASNVPIYEKAPLVGEDVVSHRSGIHQDGAAKTQGMKKGAYRAIDGAMIGRPEGDRLGFTSQSGKSAVLALAKRMGLPLTEEQAARLQPVLKNLADEYRRELSDRDFRTVYEREIA